MKLYLVLVLFAAIFLVCSGHWGWRHSRRHHGGRHHGWWRHGGWYRGGWRRGGWRHGGCRHGGCNHWRQCQNRIKFLTEQKQTLNKELDQCMSLPPPTTTTPTTTTTSPTTTTTLPTTTTTLPPPQPITDCWDVKTRQNQSSDGTYKIDSPAGGQMNVRCDMTTDNGGWLTFVRRVRGGVDFNRSWEDYKNGFGDLAGDFWLGNEFVHMFTAAKNVDMRVDMSDWEGNHAYTLYDSLLVDDEASNYTIYLGNYSGDAGDALRITMQPYQQKIMPFSTYDHGDEGLAKRFGAGFWYNRWFTALPTGRYTRITDEDDDQGVIWDSWKQYVSLKEITMSVRPKGVV